MKIAFCISIFGLIPVLLVFLGVLSEGQALPCLTSGSKQDFTKTKSALNELKNLLSTTVSTLQGQINTLNGKITALDKDLTAIEDDFKRRQWMKYNDHCYFFGTEQVPWTTAERRCREIGGYLAKIDDANENTWIHQNMIKAKKNTHFWVGMTDVYNGDWRWIYDQTKPNYKNWTSGRPYATTNADSKNANCVWIYYPNGKWYDYSCNYPTSYVCESNFSSLMRLLQTKQV